MIQSGKLQYQIDILRNTFDSIDQFGTPSGDWTIWNTISAEIIERGTTEDQDASGSVELETIIFRIRYRSLAASDRISFDGNTYDITSVKVLGRKQALELKATARNDHAGA